MRSIIRSLTILTILSALAACAEDAQTPVTPKAPPGAPRSGATPANAGQTRTYLIRMFAHGHAQTYRLSVDDSGKSMKLVTVESTPVRTCDDLTSADGCTGSGSTGSGTGGGTGILTGDLELTGTDSVYADLSSENLSADLAAAGPYHCPGRVDDPHFEWKGHHFQVEGVAERITYLPQISGLPKGRYLLPPGPWLSDDGRARIWSGTIDGTCFVQYYSWYGIITIEAGSMGWYAFHGDYEEIGDEASFASNGGEYGGVVYYSLSDLQAGDPEAYKVIMTYINDGTCTDGWVVVIDGDRVC